MMDRDQMKDMMKRMMPAMLPPGVKPVHYKADGTHNEIIHGEDPILVALTAIERNLVSRLDHAAYLGRELEKAYLSICYGFQYIQDSAPGKVE